MGFCPRIFPGSNFYFIQRHLSLVLRAHTWFYYGQAGREGRDGTGRDRTGWGGGEKKAVGLNRDTEIEP